MGRKEEITIRIQEAAIEEFIEKGVISASMENIANRAEVSKRTLYKYYPNKDEIFDDIISLLLESFCTYSGFIYKKDIPIEDQLDNIIQHKVELITSENYIKISKLVLSELLKSKKPSQKHLEQFYESEQKFIKWIDQAKKNGAVTSKLPSEIIANQFHSIIKGQLFYPVIFGIVQINENDIKVSKETAKMFFLKSFCETP